MKIKIHCDYCKTCFVKYRSKVKKHNFCSRRCLADFSNKNKNPKGYRELKDYTGISENMARINRELNPSRMDFSVRAKLSEKRRGTGKGDSYEKVFGRHLHRTNAERLLGRKLKKGEVVHHIDGNRRNNSLDNLMVFPNQAEHARFHVKGGDSK